MFIKIRDGIKRDSDYPFRQFILSCYRKFLDGEFYDHLSYCFYDEQDNQGNRIRILERRPSVKYRLCEVVVDDSISLLFGDEHFPDIECDDEETKESLNKIVEECHVKEIMINAARIGSVGSVALFLSVTEGGTFKIEPLCTEFLTPEFSDIYPSKVVKITEKYKVSGKSLIEAGYPEIEETEDYWMMRIWDDMNETVYEPFKVSDAWEDDFIPQPDLEKTTEHKFGFVPFVWIKNLPSKDKIDGACTFSGGIDANIEIDYQLSQLGRCLRYSSDPLLVISSDGDLIGGTIDKAANNALTLGKDGKASYAEIDGRSADAVLKYVEALRKTCLENMHGNRTNPEKLAMAQSGRAIQLLYQTLVWLADRLRITYGKGLKQLLEMMIAASHSYNVRISNVINIYEKETPEYLPALNIKSRISLRWQEWFPTTVQDRLQQSQCLKTLNDGGILSHETAVKVIASEYAILDVEEEINQITKERKELQKELAPLEPQVKENLNI